MSESDFPLPPPTFEFLVFSLKTQAEMRLGLLRVTEEEQGPDLPAARHAIDMLAMIAEKTRGNLSLEEQRLVENSLTELRFRFVQVLEKAPKPDESPSAKRAHERRAGDSYHRARLRYQRRRSDDRLRMRRVRFDDPRDSRLRPSILIRYGGHSVVVDTSPDFRAQALRARIERVDAILYTHSHADHILGLDDVRPFNYRQRAGDSDLCDRGDAGRDPSRVPVRIRARPEQFRGSQAASPYAERRAVRAVRPRVHAHSTDARQIRGAGIPFRSGGVSYRSQRHSGGIEGEAAGPGRVVPGCVAPSAASDAFDRGTESTVGGRTEAAARILHAHLPRSSA